MSRVVLVLGRSAGGIGAHVRSLAPALAGLGDDVAVVAPASTHAAFDLPGPVRWWPGEGGPAATREVRRLLRAADAVHAHGHQAGVLATLLLGRTAPRLAISLHNELRGDRRSPRHVVGTRAVRAAVRRADLVTGASEDLVRLARELGARAASFDEVPSPVVPELLAIDRGTWRADHRDGVLRAHGIPLDRPVALTVARLAPQKRLDDLVAIARLRPDEGEGPTFVVVGDGDPEIRHRVEAAAPPSVRLVGRADDVTAWLLAADLFLLTSEWEARALVVQEAMAAGLPVVTTRTGGLTELVAGAGRLAAVGDVTGLRAHVDALVGDPSLADRLGREGRERARGWPTVDERASSWHRWYAGASTVP